MDLCPMVQKRGLMTLTLRAYLHGPPQVSLLDGLNVAQQTVCSNPQAPLCTKYWSSIQKVIRS